MDDRTQMDDFALQKRDIVAQSSMNTITVQMAPRSTLPAVQGQILVFADHGSGFLTTVVVGNHQEHPRTPSRSRSSSPPLTSAMKPAPAWSRYRSRSQTITQRQASGSIPVAYGQPKPTMFRGTMRILSSGLSDGMRCLTLNDCEDIMDFIWE